MKKIGIRVFCCIDPDRTALQLDHAVSVLKGKRDVCLDYPTWWDTWLIPEGKEHLLTLFLSRPQDICSVE